MEIQHFSHEHPLALCEESEEKYKQVLQSISDLNQQGNLVEYILEQDDENAESKGPLCNGCYQVIRGPAYLCDICATFWLHKCCAFLPSEQQHPLHTLHSLTLLTKPPNSRLLATSQSSHLEGFICEECRDISLGFAFHCRECQFNLDVKCALLADGESKRSGQPEAETEIAHFSHPHLLTLFNSWKQLKFHCAGCQLLLSSGLAYGCFGCEFYMHKSCADMSREIQHVYHPLHPLRAQLARDLVNSDLYCDACQMQISGITYRCYDCNFDLHMLCANKTLAVKSALKHSCHEHDLYYFVESHLAGTFECIVCHNACKGYFYVCLECRHFFHLECIPILPVVKHDCHEHSLTLDLTADDDSTADYCHVCKNERSPNYHAYHCTQCPYKAHIECVASERDEESYGKDSTVATFASSQSKREVEPKIKIQHFSHEHPLTLYEESDEMYKEILRIISELNEQENLKQGDKTEETKSPLCNGCYQIIQGPAYLCEICAMFGLHKSCALLPSQLAHPLHPHHVLTLVTRPPNSFTFALSRTSNLEAFICEKCGAISPGFAFHCTECQLNLDVKCALSTDSERQIPLQPKTETKISHFGHTHELTLFDVTEKNKRLFGRCGIGCREPLSGPAYVCYQCKFALHKACSEIPPKRVHHPFHPPHPLLFQYDKYTEFICEDCRHVITCGFVFRCEECEFKLDFRCAMLALVEGKSSRSGDETETQMYHFSHRHILSLFNARQQLMYDCDGCQLLLSSGQAYGCIRCEFYIHKSCADMPREISHIYHPQHPLRAQLARYCKDKCDSCKMSMRGIGYRCSDCDFDLHILCATKTLAVRSPLRHRCHEHNLYYFVAGHLTGSFQCIICGNACKDYFYVCLECKCYFHLECVPIPPIIKHDCHMHSLTLDLIDEDDSREYYCHACENERSSEYHAYYCKQCPYTAHIECVASELTGRESGSAMMTPFELDDNASVGDQVKQNREGDAKLPALAEFASPQCQRQKETKDLDNDHTLLFREEIDMACYGCKTRITGSGYACMCEYCKISLHKECAELPLMIDHPLHSLHPLTLVPPDVNGHFVCDGCLNFRRGNVSYQCDQCRFIIDMTCASSSYLTSDQRQNSKEKRSKDTIRHFSHVHILQRANFVQLEVRCNVCGLWVSGLAFCCLECKFFLHDSCREVPEEIEHPFHPNHNLKFCEFFPIHTCYVCGLIMSNRSAYHCPVEEGSFLVHTTCATYLTSALKYEGHGHKLFYFVKHDLGNFGFIQSSRGGNLSEPHFFHCAACRNDCNGSFYRCLECGVNLHLECIPIPKTVKGKCHIHPLTLMDSVVEEYYDEQYCYACETQRNPDHAVYYCGNCKYSAHIGCVLDEEDTSLEILSFIPPPGPQAKDDLLLDIGIGVETSRVNDSMHETDEVKVCDGMYSTKVDSDNEIERLGDSVKALSIEVPGNFPGDSGNIAAASSRTRNRS